MAAAGALEFALEIGITNAVMEGNSLLVTQAFVAHTNSLANSKFLCNNFNELYYSHLYYSHVMREGNKIARSLARHAKHIVDFVV